MSETIELRDYEQAETNLALKELGVDSPSTR